jgi:hypothetical protein
VWEGPAVVLLLDTVIVSRGRCVLATCAAERQFCCRYGKVPALRFSGSVRPEDARDPSASARQAQGLKRVRRPWHVRRDAGLFADAGMMPTRQRAAGRRPVPSDIWPIAAAPQSATPTLDNPTLEAEAPRRARR